MLCRGKWRFRWRWGGRAYWTASSDALLLHIPPYWLLVSILSGGVFPSSMALFCSVPLVANVAAALRPPVKVTDDTCLCCSIIRTHLFLPANCRSVQQLSIQSLFQHIFVITCLRSKRFQILGKLSISFLTIAQSQPRGYNYRSRRSRSG